MTGYNRNFASKARAKGRAAAQLKAKKANRQEPQDLVRRSPQSSPKPGYDSNGNFDPAQYKIDMASYWLGGYLVEGPTGMLLRVYLQGDDERKGRKALAELLWKREYHPGLMQLLAQYIAPDGHEFADSDFRLTIERRGPGADERADAALQVGLTIWQDIKAGRKVGDGVALAAARFGLGDRQVWEYWRQFKEEHRSGFEALEALRNNKPEAD